MYTNIFLQIAAAVAAIVLMWLSVFAYRQVCGFSWTHISRVTVGILFGGLLLHGCSYDTHLGVRNQLANSEQRAKLIEKLEQEDTSEIDQAVKLLNLGMIYRLDGQYKKSIVQLERAKDIIATQRAASVTEGVTSLVVNNTTESYTPNATEEQNLHIMQAANFLDLGQPGGARVEVLQREQFIKEYPPELYYPFADYFAGMVFELSHEPDNALISYRRAYDGYRRLDLHVPEPLLQDYARLLNTLGFRSELEQLQAKGTISYPKVAPNITILIARGLVPEKVEDRFDHFDPVHQASFSIALPAYPAQSLPIDYPIEINGNSYPTTGVGNVDAMVRYELDETKAALVAQAIVRQIAKRGIANAIQQESEKHDLLTDLLVSAITEITVIASESADLRSWNTLPASISMYRAHLPEGSYLVQTQNTQSLQVEIHNANQVLRLVHATNN